MSIISFSQAKEIVDFRIDSNSYLKEYLVYEKLLKSKKNMSLKDCSKSIQNFGAYSLCNFINFVPNGIPYLMVQSIGNNIINWDTVKYIDDASHKMLYKSHCHKNQVLMAMAGSLGNAAVYNKDFICSSNQAIAKITLNENLNPYFLSTFLLSKYGEYQINKLKTVTAQPNINMSLIGKIRIPLLSNAFQSQIEQIVKSAHAKLEESKSLYAEAEEILLSELGLKDWQPKKNSHTDSILLTQNQDEDTKTKRDSVGILNPCDSSNPCGNIANYSIKRFSDFASSGRLDAEYYQSKYDELEEKLSQFQLVKIKDIINYPVCSGSTPKAGDSQYYTDSKNGIPFLRAVDIIQSRVDMSDLLYIKSDVHNGLLNRTQLKKNDVLFSIAGTVGRCGIFDYDFEANINQAIAIIRFDESVVKHLYVIQFFNSKIGQLLIEKYARQGLQTNLNLEEVSNLYLPVISMEIQTLIAEKIQKSFDLRKESKEFLESAKRMVEEEIEK